MDKIAYYINEIEKLAKEKKDDGKILLGGAMALGGGAAIKHQYDKGHLTGRETMWHGSSDPNIKNILEQGLLSSKATDPNNVTNKAMKENKMFHPEDIANKVYFARNKNMSSGSRALSPEGARTVLKAKVPAWKLKEVDNPELGRAKNLDEYIKTVRGHYPDREIPTKHLKHNWDLAGRKGTATFEGNVGPEVFTKSKHFKKLNLSELGEFIKKNPKRFAKGLGIAGLGAGAIMGGTSLIKNNLKSSKPDSGESIG